MSSPCWPVYTIGYLAKYVQDILCKILKNTLKKISTKIYCPYNGWAGYFSGIFNSTHDVLPIYLMIRLYTKHEFKKMIVQSLKEFLNPSSHNSTQTHVCVLCLLLKWSVLYCGDFLRNTTIQCLCASVHWASLMFWLCHNDCACSES